MTVGAKPSPGDIEVLMFLHVQRMINEIVPDEPDPAAANALQEGLAARSARCAR